MSLQFSQKIPPRHLHLLRSSVTRISDRMSILGQLKHMEEDGKKLKLQFSVGLGDKIVPFLAAIELISEPPKSSRQSSFIYKEGRLATHPLFTTTPVSSDTSADVSSV